MLEKHIEIANFLDDEILVQKYKKLNQHLTEGQFLLPVMGQFSSGKSCFINNFLEHDILPVKTTETTAYLTYIAYSETEKVTLISTDGEKREIPLSKLSIIHEQGSSSLNKSLDLPASFQIQQISVELPNDFLKSGIVLVDTPGLNTLKTNHEVLTYSVLPNADYFIYVVRKSVTEKDCALISQIQALGTEVIVIRTHIDEVNASEESLEEIIAHEKEVLFQTNSVTKYFPTSNIKDPVYGGYRSQIKDSFDAIFGHEIKDLVTESIQLRLTSDKSMLNARLLEKKEQSKYVNDLEIEDVQDRIKAISKNISVLKLNIDRAKRSSKFENEISSELSLFLLSLRKKIVNLFSLSIKSGEQPDTVALNLFNQATDDLGIWYHDRLNDIKLKCEKEYNANLEIIFENDIYSREQVNFTFHDVEEHSAIVEQMLGEINDLESTISEKEQEQIKVKSSTTAANLQLQELESNVNALHDELTSHENSYETQYTTIEGKKVSDTFKFIGKGLDIASLIIPTTAMMQIGKVGKVVKGLEIVKDGGTAIKKLTEGTKLANAAINTAKKLKPLKDGAAIVSKQGSSIVKGAVRQNKAKLSGLGMLDLLTFEYWTEKAGRCFDKPDTQVIDTEYEQAYKQQAKAIELQYANNRNIYLQRKLEIDNSMSEADRLEKGIEFDKKFKAQKQIQLQKEVTKLQKRQQKMLNDDICAQFDIVIDDFISHQKEGVLTQLKKVEENYLHFATVKLTTKIASLQNDLTKQETSLLEGKGKLQCNDELLNGYINYLND